MTKKLMMFVAAVAAAFGAWADTWADPDTGYTWTYQINGDTAEIFNYCSTAISPSPTGAVTIPSTLGGKPVTSIGSYAFSGCSGLTSVMIPDSVTSIGNAAFSDCSGLTGITVPNSVTNVEDYAFRGCTNITSITWPGELDVGWAFNTIGEDGSVTFGGDSIKTIFVSEGSLRIGDYVFDCFSGVTNVVIPTSVKNIGSGAFYYCTNLTSVTIPDSVTSIGDSAFSGCSEDLFDTATIPGVKLVDGWAVGNTGALLGDLDLIGIRGIGASAFMYCSGLTSVTIPKSVANIGDGAFAGCRITNFIIDSGNETYKMENGLLLSKDGRTLVAGIVCNGDVVIPDSVTTIRPSAFWCCWGLTSVTIPYSVTSIGHGAFLGCSGLTSVTIPDSVTSIGSSAFLGCSGLTSVTIPDSVTSIDNQAFQDCSGLTSITIPDSVTSIGSEAFSGCSDSLFDTATIPGVKLVDGWAIGHADSLSGSLDLVGIRGIGVVAFSGCDGLTSVTIPDGVTSIGSSAFRDCSGLTSVTIPDSVTSIGDSAFYNCSGLTSVTIPDSVTSIGYVAFYGCSGLTSVTIGNSVTSIGSYAFSDCSGLTSVTIGNSVTSIGSYAFSDCSGLTSVTIPDSVTSIGDYAFAWCSGLTNIVFGCNAPSVGSSTFSVLISGCVVYVPRGSTGWGVEIPGIWNGMRIEYAEDVSPDVWTVTFDANGGSVSPVTRSVVDGSAVGVLPTPARSGYTFGGWYTAVNGGTEIASSTVVTGAVTYYAHWSAIPVPEPIWTMDSNGVLTGADLNGCTDIVIPDSVTSIGSSAFNGCSSLTSVTIPDGVTSIGSYAFCDCGSLTSVTIGNGVTSIGDEAFEGCSSLTSVTIPDSVTSIGSYAFCDCISLASVTIGGGVTSIGEGAFEGCSDSLFDTMTIPGVKLVDGWAIGYTDSLSGNLDLTGVRGVGPYAFAGCSGLTSVTIPDSVTSIGYDAFSDCSDSLFDTMTIPGVMLVDGWAVGHTDLLPDNLDLAGVRGIGPNAFNGCSQLKVVKIPGSVVSIGAGAFSECGAVQDFIVDVSNRSYKSSNGFLLAADGTTIICAPEGRSDIVIPDGVTRIGAYSFADRENLTSVTIPDSVTVIEDGAFRECYSLTNVVLSANLKSLGYTREGWDAVGVFEGCSGLRIIVLPDGVVNIGYGSFSDCENLASITIPDSVTSIGSYAFEGCSGLVSVTIGSGVTSIGEGSFYCGESLASIVFEGNAPNGVDDAFDSDSSCTVYVPRGSTGWGVEIPGIWNGMRIEYAEDVSSDVWTVTFDANGGELADGDSSRQVEDGTPLGELPVPSRLDYTFLGWFMAAHEGELATVETLVTNDVTFYAHWTPSEVANVSVDGDKGEIEKTDAGYVVTAKDGVALTEGDFTFGAIAKEAYKIEIAEDGKSATVTLAVPQIGAAEEASEEKDEEDATGLLVVVDEAEISSKPEAKAGEAVGALPAKTYPGLYYQASWGGDLSNLTLGEKVRATGESLYLGVIKQTGDKGFYKLSVSEK